METDFTPFLRVSSISEKLEDKKVILDVEGELIPRYTLGLPDITEDLEKVLTKLYNDNLSKLPNRIGKVVRDLAIEAMITNAKPKRAEKLEKLKFVFVDSEIAYDPQLFLLKFTFRFKPKMVPVFEPNFFHEGILYSEPLDEKLIEVSPSVS